MTVDTTFLKRERQYKREFPEIACKIGLYEAEVGIHKFTYRDIKTEINLFVIQLKEDTMIKYNRHLNMDDS